VLTPITNPPSGSRCTIAWISWNSWRCGNIERSSSSLRTGFVRSRDARSTMGSTIRPDRLAAAGEGTKDGGTSPTTPESSTTLVVFGTLRRLVPPATGRHSFPEALDGDEPEATTRRPPARDPRGAVGARRGDRRRRAPGPRRRARSRADDDRDDAAEDG